MKKILAVDDEQDIRTLLKESLELEGYLVYTAKNGMEAMEGLKYHPDLIILDVNMPDLDGYTVCEKIRNYIDCPILFLTARTQEQDRVNGFKAGGDDYIVKPFGMDEMRIYKRRFDGGFFRPSGIGERGGRRAYENRIFHCGASDFPQRPGL